MLQELTLFDPRRAIHSQNADCNSARGSQGEDFATAKFKVVVPAIHAWMKQRIEFAGFGID